jgi:hypothetical protein
MVHLGGTVRECQAELVVATGEVLVWWGGGAGAYPCSLTSGRLKGDARVRSWRVHRRDLAVLRKAAGWRRPKLRGNTVATPEVKELPVTSSNE